MRQSETRDDLGAILPTRPRELQDSLNFHLYHPLARRLAMYLVNTPVTPNMVSFIGGLLVVATAVVYSQASAPIAVFAGLVLHMLWHVFDGADGDLARFTNQASRAGEIIDGICDYTSHIILYFTLAWLISPEYGWGGLLFAALAGASRVIQANHYENRRRYYEFLVYGRPWMRSDPLIRQQGIARAFNWIETGYLVIGEKMTGRGANLSEMHQRYSQDAKKLSRFRNLVVQHVQPTLGPLSMLGANHRTIVLGLSMLAGSPIYFFAYELIALNIVLLLTISHYKQALRTVADQCVQVSDERSANSLR
jgi:phosphatidylglycerophosphate synthase